jgi:hypothetical protein
MYSIAMDVGKYRTYGIVERDGKITKEGYMPTTKEGFRSFMRTPRKRMATLNHISGDSRKITYTRGNS